MIRIGYNDGVEHKGSKDCFEKPDRLKYCISDLKKILLPETFICSKKYSEMSLELIDMIEKIALMAHTQEHINRIKNYSTNTFTCRDCGKKNYHDENMTFREYLKTLKACAKCGANLTCSNVYCFVSIDTYMTPQTYCITTENVNILRMLLDDLHTCADTNKYAFGLIRPPGHHCNNSPAGFCILNNVMIATKYALKLGWKKVLILDVDFHHGDGTQALLEAEENLSISFVSIHGYGECIYPGTGKKSISEKNILNIPLEMSVHLESREYITDDFYQYLINERVMPFIQEQNPELIIISLGFDAHADDPLEGTNITDETFLHITTKLKSLQIPLLFITEGGYNAKTIRRVVPKMIKILDDE